MLASNFVNNKKKIKSINQIQRQLIIKTKKAKFKYKFQY